MTTEVDKLGEIIAGLLEHGFVEVQECDRLRVGTRVRHNGHQWPDAYISGTGNVERIFHLPKSSWEQRYGRPNIEIIMRRDNGDFMFVADYHLSVTEGAA